jgi:plastocyanin
MRKTIICLVALFTTTASVLAAPPLVNDCTPATAIDMTGLGAVAITFPNGVFPNYSYSPKCVHVSAGTTISFNGTFSSHPLVGGQVVGVQQFPDPNSPIPLTSDGTTQSYIAGHQGLFGYYCDFHAVSSSMYGAILVGSETVFSDSFESL